MAGLVTIRSTLSLYDQESEVAEDTYPLEGDGFEALNHKCGADLLTPRMWLAPKTIVPVRFTVKFLFSPGLAWVDCGVTDDA